MEAVAQALRARYGARAQVHGVDVFVASGRWPFYHLPAWYPAMLKGRGIFWRLGFGMLNGRRRVVALTRLLFPYVAPALRALLARYEPDLVASFHPLPNRLLALVGREQGIPTATVVLDFLTAPAFWFAPGLDLYSVAYPEMRARASRLGAPPERVEVLGMPVRQAMVRAQDLAPQEARKRLGLAAEQPLVLVLSGGDGVGPLEALTRSLLSSLPQVTLAVVTGRNERMRQRLQRMRDPRLYVLGFVKETLPLWMRAAEVLVTKAGPNTLAEAFVMGLPTVLFGAIPGQEEGNVQLVLRHHAGVWAPGPERSARAVARLMENPHTRAAMRQQARALATPQAADRIAQRLWHMASHQRGCRA